MERENEAKVQMKHVFEELEYLFPRCGNPSCGNTIYTNLVKCMLYRKTRIQQGDTYPLVFSCKSTKECDFFAYVCYIGRYSN